MKTSIKALVLALSMIAGSSFAADLSTLVDLSLTSDAAAAAGMLNVTSLAPETTENLAVIASFGAGAATSYATIEQALGVGNAAFIVQDNATNPGTAAIYQAGSMNVAKIVQR